MDGQGDLTFAFDDPAVGGGLPLSAFTHAFFPADGSAGLLVAKLSLLGPRPDGFFRTLSTEDFLSQWDFAIAPDGSDEGVTRNDSDPQCKNFIYFRYNLTADPRGGYVESRIHAEFSSDHTEAISKLELRWVDADLVPRTSWLVGPEWEYPYNVYPDVYVDGSGKALAMLFFDPPMSMPCNGSMTKAVWASDDGSVVIFDPITPVGRSHACDAPQFAGFGTALVLSDGGVAFYHPPGGSSDGFFVPSPSGWYVRYPSGSGVATTPPAWLNQYDGNLKLLAGAHSYLGTSRDAATCARRAEIVGPAGQLCATLELDGSDGCADTDQLSPDGTLVLHAWSSCSVRWWPKLGTQP